jgi:hypothetical protein
VASLNGNIARYALGVVALILILGSLAVAAVKLRRRLLGDWTGAPARLAEVVIGSALLVAILEVLGAVGLFALAPVTAACAIAAGVVWRGLGAPAGAHSRTTRDRGPTGWSVRIAGAVAILGAAAAFAEWGALTIQSYDVGIRGFDSLWYHLPWAASYAQTGNIVSLRFTDVEYLTAFYPATAEAMHGLGIVLLTRDTLSPALNLLWLGLVLLAAYCIGRPRGAGPAALLGAALAMATSMMDYSQAGSAANDVVAVFFLLAAVAIVMQEDERPAAIVVAAIAAGLALGVKLTVVAAVLALTVGVVVIAPRGRRLATPALGRGPLILAGASWYARNLVAVGNPVPWSKLGFLPTPAPALQQNTGFSIAHYVTHGAAHLWSGYFEPGLASGLGRWWYLILAAGVIGPLLCLVPDRRGARPEAAGRTVRMLGLVALFSLAAYLITPESAAGPAGDPLGFAFNLRYLAPALTLTLIVLPLAPPLAGPERQLGATVALAALFAGTVAQRQLWPSQHEVGAVVIGAVVVIAGVAWSVARSATDRIELRRVRPRAVEPGRLGPANGGRIAKVRPRAAGFAIVAVLVAAGAAAGYRLQDHYLRGRYSYHPGVSYLSRVWAIFRDVRHARVGIVGTFGGFFAYPLAGLDDSNRVQYVARRGPHGSFTPIATCARWRTQVNADHLNYLITTPARDPWHPKVLSPSPETRWTASDPAARPVFSETALGQPIVVFRIDGALSPAGCAKLI